MQALKLTLVRTCLRRFSRRAAGPVAADVIASDAGETVTFISAAICEPAELEFSGVAPVARELASRFGASPEAVSVSLAGPSPSSAACFQSVDEPQRLQ